MMFGTQINVLSLVAYASAKKEYSECKWQLAKYEELLKSGLLMPWEITEFNQLQEKMKQMKNDILPEINKFTEEVINKEKRYYNIITSYLNDIDGKLLPYLL